MELLQTLLLDEPLSDRLPLLARLRGWDPKPCPFSSSSGRSEQGRGLACGRGADSSPAYAPAEQECVLTLPSRRKTFALRGVERGVEGMLRGLRLRRECSAWSLDSKCGASAAGVQVSQPRLGADSRAHSALPSQESAARPGMRCDPAVAVAARDAAVVR